MRKLVLSLFTFGFIFALGLNNVHAQGDMNCDDFDTWEQAQQYFESKGGSPSKNVDDLDRDNDGMACDSLADAPEDWTWAEAHPDGTMGENEEDGTEQGGQQDGAADDQGGQLPDTASNYGNGILAGLGAILAGAILFFRKKARENN